MKTDDSEGDSDSAATPTLGSFPKGASAGYQIGSEEPATLESTLDQASSDHEEDRSESGGIDPFEAFARAESENAAERQSPKEKRGPAIWLPGPDDLDHEPGQPDSETGFSRDRWRRGNPQVSVRLRPLDFDRLRRAADLYGVRPTTLARMMVIRGVRAILDAELRQHGDLFREGPDY